MIDVVSEVRALEAKLGEVQAIAYLRVDRPGGRVFTSKGHPCKPDR